MNVATDDLANEYRATIPVLDDPISPAEGSTQISKSKADKACCPDSITPGVFMLLPAQWTMLITTLFNSIFATAHYPTLWTRARFFYISKKGHIETL